VRAVGSGYRAAGRVGGANGRDTLAEVAKTFNVDPTTIGRLRPSKLADVAAA
jgi:hypothetical protein